MMLQKITRLTPWPMPFSVISSPIHIRKQVPAVSVTTIWTRVSEPPLIDLRCRPWVPCAQHREQAERLDHGQHHRQIARVLRDLLAAALAFLRQLLPAAASPPSGAA